MELFYDTEVEYKSTLWYSEKQVGHINGLFLHMGSKQTRFNGCSACLSLFVQIWKRLISGLGIFTIEGINK